MLVFYSSLILEIVKMPSRNSKRSNKGLTWDLRDASCPLVDPSTVSQNLIKNGLNGKVGGRKPFLRSRNKV